MSYKTDHMVKTLKVDKNKLRLFPSNLKKFVFGIFIGIKQSWYLNPADLKYILSKK